MLIPCSSLSLRGVSLTCFHQLYCLLYFSRHITWTTETIKACHFSLDISPFPYPKTTLSDPVFGCVQNWLAEFRKWLGPERLQVFVVTGDSRVEVRIHFKVKLVFTPAMYVIENVWQKS